MTSGTLHSILSAMSPLASLLLILLCTLIVSKGVRESTKRRWKPVTFTPLTTPMQIHIPEVQRLGKRTVFIATMTLIAGLGIGYAASYAQFHSNRKPMVNVLVTEIHPDGSYTMLAEDGRKFETTFCHGRDPLLPGNRLEEFNFEQRTGCKNIYGSGLGYRATTAHGVRLIFPIPQEVADVR